MTLANLYLQQGHLDDAERAFREVLDRDSSNSEARVGLGEIQRQRSEESDVVESHEAAGRSRDGNGTSSRKVEILQAYLRRIRAASKQ